MLEVGLGGRLDATNVIERPVASVITPVSMDHMEFLGDTLESIAAEKAAIIRANVPAVIGRQTEGPLAVITDRAECVGAPLCVLGQDWTVGEERGRLVYQDLKGLMDLPAPRLYGRHQFDNAGTAIAALRTSGLALPASAFEQGILKADWPARLQRLTTGKLAALVPPGSELWLDGSHNADGGRITAAVIADFEERVAAAADPRGRHVVHQGHGRLSRQFHRPCASADRGAGPPGQRPAGRHDRRRGPQ